MSAGQGNRRSSSFTRRGSSAKKVKHKKQDFHEHRIRLVESGPALDFSTLRDRTIQSLERLGHQAFTLESGYGLESWLKSLRYLLDEFEAAASSQEIALPEAYTSRKAEVFSSLPKAADFPQLDAQIAEAKEAEKMVRAALGNKDAAYYGSTLTDLDRKRTGLQTQLDSERAEIARLKAQPRPGRFFRVILGEKPPSTAEKEANASRLAKELADVDVEIAIVQGEELLFKDGKRQLAFASDHLAELEAEKIKRLQLQEEREQATKLLADEISKVNPGGREAGQRV